jgi:hypothetical protein
MSVLVLFVVELGLHALVYIKKSGSGILFEDTEITDKSRKRRIERWNLSAFTETSWGKEYWDEIHKARSYDYHPFIGWRKKEFEGKHVNVSADGIRKTWNPEFENREEVETVYVFGGSATWGFGSRDDFTIPSLLSKKLNESKKTYSVVNYGEAAYTLTQEIIHLTLLLKNGERPDHVIFYDGINEVLSAYENGVAGSIYNLHEMKDIFENNMFRQKRSVSNAGLIWKGLTGVIRDNSMICRAFSQGTLYVAGNKRFRGEGAYSAKRNIASAYNDDELALLSEEIVSKYLRGMDLIGSLSRIYGFRHIFVWQPVLYSKKYISPEESTYSKGWKNRVRKKLFEKVYGLIEKKRIEHFHDISNVFDEVKDTLYIDFWHVTEKGNEIAADRIYDIFKKEERF